MYFVDWTHQSGAILASLQAPLRRRPLSSSALRPASNGPLFAGRRDRRLNKIRIWVDSYCVDVDYVGSLASLGVSSWRPAEVAIGRSSQKERALWEIEDKIRSSVPNRAPRRERSGAQWCAIAFLILALSGKRPMACGQVQGRQRRSEACLGCCAAPALLCPALPSCPPLRVRSLMTGQDCSHSLWSMRQE